MPGFYSAKGMVRYRARSAPHSSGVTAFEKRPFARQPRLQNRLWLGWHLPRRCWRELAGYHRSRRCLWSFGLFRSGQLIGTVAGNKNADAHLTSATMQTDVGGLMLAARFLEA